MVDWSSASVPKTGSDSVWIAHLDTHGLRLENPSTRREAVTIISDILDSANGRVFAGFDFAFGYPKGTAKALTNGGWQDLWTLLSGVVEDGPDNANNRFDAAGELNKKFDGNGPFWGNGLKRDVEGLPRKCPSGYDEVYPSRNRYAEMQVKGTQEVWKLSGVGSVGGQALTGIATLVNLRQKYPVAIWPFEDWQDDRHVFCEIYPSIITRHKSEKIKDAGQVRAMAEAVARADALGNLKDLLSAPDDMPNYVKQEEGCVLGQSRPEILHGMDYEKDPAAIYAKSFATVRREADLSGLPNDLHPVAIRLIHACGMVDLPKDLTFSNDVYQIAHKTIKGGAAILCDCEMVGAGIIRRYLSGNDVIVTLNHPDTPDMAKELKTTRSAAAVEHWRDHIEGAVVVIGNAPTTLFHLLEKLDEGWPKPAAILGFPVGFVGAAESKTELASNPRGVPFIALQGRRGGSAMASAALNAMAAGLPEEKE